MEIQEIITNILSLLIGGGLSKLWTLRQESRKVKAEADCESARFVESEIKNTDQIIEVYKKALADFKTYYEQKECLLVANNESLKKEISNLSEQVVKLKDSNTILSNKLKDAEAKLDKFNQLYKSLDK